MTEVEGERKSVINSVAFFRNTFVTVFIITDIAARSTPSRPAFDCICHREYYGLHS